MNLATALKDEGTHQFTKMNQGKLFTVDLSNRVNMKMYIAVLDEFPDYMCPTLVAHAVLGAHLLFTGDTTYDDWLSNSFKKCVLRVNRKEFTKISQLDKVYLAHENHTLNAEKSCAVVCPREEIPNVLKFAKLWKPATLNKLTTS